jgi:predicted nucleotidyltransferase component of viral defense system
MTNEARELLDKIKNHPLFDSHAFFFIGGTALSVYLNHRVSYDIDIACTHKLPIAQIKAFAFALGASVVADKNRAAFRINRGEDIENYHLRFTVDGIKLEFSHFSSPVQMSIIENAEFTPYDEGSKLKILAIRDIISLKIFALFNRRKSRDLFDAAVILEKNLLDIKELERIYSYTKEENHSIREYISAFKVADNDSDNSLDFLPPHEHYKVFAKKNQNERFIKAKEMFLQIYDKKQKEALGAIKKAAVKNMSGE